MKRYRTPLKWVLYALGFLLALLLESSALGHTRFFGAPLSLTPPYVCCVACREGHEAGGVFALGAALFWALSGVTGGPVVVALLPGACMAASFLCGAYFTRTLLPAMAGCLFSLVLCQGGIYAVRLFMGNPMPPDAARLLLAQTGCSMVPAPFFWWLTKFPGKAGGMLGT